MTVIKVIDDFANQINLISKYDFGRIQGFREKIDWESIDEYKRFILVRRRRVFDQNKNLST